MSVAGKRKGLDGDRSGLFFDFMRILAASQAEWVVIENVPGLLTSDRGRDFHTVLATLAELGYVDRAYRILDSRYFRVAQRRRRVFVVARRGTECGRAGAVLLESTGGGGNPAAGGEAGPRVARGAAVGADGVGFCLRADPGGTGQGHNTNYVTAVGVHANQRGELRTSPLAGSLTAQRSAKQFEGVLQGGPVAFNWQSGGDCRYGFGETTSGLSTNQTPAVYQCHGSNVGPMGTLRAGNGNEAGGVPFVAVTLNSGGNSGGFRTEPGEHLVSAAVTSKWAKGTGGPAGDECQNLAPIQAWQESQSGVRSAAEHPTLDAHNGSRRHQGALTEHGVRRLTPRECERLQGFPDGWTCLCPAQGDTATCVCPDSPRYKQMGNAVTVPVIRWIAARLRAEAQRQQEGAA